MEDRKFGDIGNTAGITVFTWCIQDSKLGRYGLQLMPSEVAKH